MKNQPQATCWFTAKIFVCPCNDGKARFSMRVPIATDGRTEWAECQRCGKVWDVATGKEMVKP